MMNRDEFKEALSPMAQIYGQMNQATMAIYYDILKKYNLNLFRKAVYIVLEFHKYKSWPTIGSFSEAIEDVKRESSSPTTKELKKRYDRECETCQNTGWVMTQMPFYGKPYNYVIYCQCPAGQDMKAAHEEGKRKIHEARRKK